MDVYARVLRRLKYVFATENDVLMFAASGSGALESAVGQSRAPRPSRCSSPRAASSASAGPSCADAYGGQTVHWETEWGQKVEPAELDRVLGENPDVDVVFTTLSETSTGVINDVRELAEVAHRHDALIVVDAVSGLGAVPVPQDEWNLDVVVSGSQKALMSPPGLAFASPNEARSGVRRRHRDAALLLRLGAHGRRPAQGPAGQPVHPGGRSRGGARRGARHDRGRGPRARCSTGIACSAGPCREAVRALDLETYGPDDEGANVVTAINLPESIDGNQVPKLMRDRYGITIAGGQAKLKGKIARLAHCGYFGAFDILLTLSAFEMTLSELGHDLELGAAWLPRSGCSSRPACPLVRARVSAGPRQGEDRRLRRAAAARRRARRRGRHRLVAGGAREPDRRVRRHADPLGHQARPPT